MFASVRRWLKWLVVFVVIGTPAMYFLMSKSEAFAAAAVFLRGNPEVVRHLGPISDASLNWRGGSLKEGSDFGQAQFTVSLEGRERGGRAYVELRKRGVWEVRFARLIPDSGPEIVLLEAASESKSCAARCEP
jgi:hypothetical protein